MTRLPGLALALTFVALAGIVAPAAADPLVSRGIGASNCSRVANDIKPADGLGNPLNVMLYAWVQGYVSAANFLLLNEYHNYVDMNSVQVATILKLVVDHCKAHPNDKPISAIDKFIRDAKKIEVDEKEVFNPWPQ